jgi:biopolymer transport protein ExbD
MAVRFSNIVFVTIVLACSACGPSPAKHKTENIVISVNKNGKIYLNGKPTNCSELKAMFESMMPKNASHSMLQCRGGELVTVKEDSHAPQ